MKYYGKEKCRILKQIRAEIARQNDIEWVVSECKHQGNCRGTCPKCEAEVRELEDALARREALGKKVAVVGISAGIALSVTGCLNPLFTTEGVMMETLSGDAVAESQPPTETHPPLEGEVEMMGEPVLPPESESESEIYEPLMGDMPIPGEVPETDTETETSDPLGNIGEWDKVEP